MKYPQLVSPRAVNAISDWLVSRLEQLGVESPQIYTRLLLSLLQSSVQVNDPIEFSNLEAFFASRKGGHSKRFHLPSDTETLKKLNAVHCLREIVSNEHETTAIELLVNELCEKLKEIEQRSHNLNDEEIFLVCTTPQNIERLSAESGEVSLKAVATDSCVDNNIGSQHLCRNTVPILTAQDNSRRQLSSENDPKDLENDPKKRYFRAFPALTKEMEDSFRVWRRNAKSLTWPIVGRSIAATSNISLIASSSSNANLNLTPSAKGGEKTFKDEEVSKQKIRSNTDISGSIKLDSEVQATSAKKKSKRRRNQVLAKGKPPQNLRKITLGNSSSSKSAPGCNKYYQHHRNISPTWDTDFKGCWEMGPDLIKEFLSRQKIATKRSRSNSNSMENLGRKDCNAEKSTTFSNEKFPPGKAIPATKRFINISSKCANYDVDADDDDISKTRDNEEEEFVDYVDEDYDDDNTLDSMPELIGANSGNPRRLYQREGILQKPLLLDSAAGDRHNKLLEDLDFEEQNDFDNFKAKFNSSVEALWKDVDQSDEVTNKKRNSIGISSTFYANTSLNALAPFKHDLWNFWSNYSQNQYNPVSSLSMTTNGLDESMASSGVGFVADIANSSDYFSMPSNLDDFDKSVGAVRRHNEAGASLGAQSPSINVFLQNSIWSSSGDCVDAVGLSSAGESDESFLYKVWHSNKMLSQIEVGQKKEEMITSIFKDNDVRINRAKESMNTAGVESGAKLDFLPYSSLKWSEGINAGPPYNSLNSSNDVSDRVDKESLHTMEQKFASFGSAETVTGANWEAPIYGENVQPDLKSWCASNPISLTEMYGSDVCDSISQESQVDADEVGPAVTLPNHCPTTSGFLAYSRIKQCGFIPPKTVTQQSINANSSRLAKDYFRSSEEENLLTSDSTHFHPIKNYVDGYSFSISSALDVVDFERSSSGYLLFESNEYMELKRNELCVGEKEVSDEEVATTNLSNFTASASGSGTAGISHDAKTKERESFVIKFRLHRSGEIACQTEEEDFIMAAAKLTEQASPVVCTEEITMFYNNDMAMAAAQSKSDVILAAVTKAVAAAAKVAAHHGLDGVGTSSLPWVPITSQHHRQQQSWCEYPPLCDEVDSSNNNMDSEQLNQYWSMQAIEMQCHQRRLPPNTFDSNGISDIEKNDENSMDNSSHTLWGMCAVCNSCDYGQSKPANRLLRDELNLEADEIMSDLRYMQDLYIGESGGCCSDYTDFDRSIDNDTNANGSAQDERNTFAKADSINVGHVQASMLKKVNRLIEDLLKPEQTGKLMKMTTRVNEAEGHVEEDVAMTNVWSLSTDDNVKELEAQSWHSNDQLLSRIWHHESKVLKTTEGGIRDSEDSHKNLFIKHMKQLRQVGGSLNEEDLYIDKLNWEHDNLAKIWQQTKVDSTVTASKKINGYVSKGGEINRGEINLVEKNNLKNLHCITRTPTSPPSPSSNALAAATYKRVQQFLNNSANKLKIAANRKRRHSASQNFYHQQQQQQQQLNISSEKSSNNNNNNDNITNLNRYKQKIATSSTGSTTKNQIPSTLEQGQTVITCKYWTTTTNGTQASLESAAAAMMLLAAATNTRNDGFIGSNSNYEEGTDVDDIMLEENPFGNTFSCLIDRNATLLKHVTMMTRPLTR